jgi:hypothetical protein
MKSKLTIDKYGTKKWKLPNGLLHREDGPACEWNDSDYKAFYINGELHREDGPAVEYHPGDKVWYLNDIQYTEKEYKNEIRCRKLNKLLK